MANALRGFLSVLIEPNPRIKGNEDRRGARLFSVLILVQVVLIVIGLFVVNAFLVRSTARTIWSAPDAWVVMGATAILLTAFMLIRLGFYRGGVILCIATAAVVAVTGPFMNAQSEIGLLATAVIPVLLASLIFRYRLVIAILVALTAVAVVELLTIPMSAAKAGTGYGLLIVSDVVGALIIISRVHFGALERDRLDRIRKNEAEIAAGAERLRALLANSQDMILVLDADGSPRFVAGACQKIMGLSREEIIGAPIFPNVHPEDEQRLREELSRCVCAPGGVSRVEWRHRRRDGRWLYLEAVASNQLGTPGVSGIVVSVRDVTERREAGEQRLRLEEQLQQASKMESIGRLAGGVAHDFNNMLTAIIGNSELLQVELRGNDMAGESLGEIRRAADSAVSLTRQLLAFSRRQVVEPRVFDLNERIAPMSKLLSRLIGENIKLRTVLADGAGALRMDPGLLEQIVVNLTVNARDAMPDGGILTIETAGRDLGAPQPEHAPAVAPGAYVELSVTDTGSGIPAQVMRHIFEPFFTTKPLGQGTGLGLATVYGAVKQSDGHIEVKSQPGRGSTFTILFPRVPLAPEAEVAPDTADETTGGSETILLVEDDPSIRDLAIRTLTRLGYQVLHAPSGEEALALAKARRDPIHLLLTDVVLPGMNGRQLATELSQLRGDLRVLFSSGYSRDIIAQHGTLEDGIAFLAKPYSLSDLARRVRSTLDGASGT